MITVEVVRLLLSTLRSDGVYALRRPRAQIGDYGADDRELLDAVTNAASKPTQCDVCHTTSTAKRLSLCGRCQKAAYCGIECQRAAWRDGGHQLECANAVAFDRACVSALCEDQRDYHTLVAAFALRWFGVDGAAGGAVRLPYDLMLVRVGVDGISHAVVVDQSAAATVAAPAGGGYYCNVHLTRFLKSSSRRRHRFSVLTSLRFDAPAELLSRDVQRGVSRYLAICGAGGARDMPAFRKAIANLDVATGIIRHRDADAATA